MGTISLERWVKIALVNLVIVALLGLLMRYKLTYSLPFIDFKNILHAHSHFAFGGWVTLALLSTMTYQMLPAPVHAKPVYRWLLAGILINAFGMLLSFPFQGYGGASITFSTLFIFVTYGYTYVFIKDLLNTPATKPVKLLSIAAVISMSLSSVGAFTLAYLMASKSGNVILYKDAVYTYLHLQYSGFFTLAVFALMLHHLKIDNKHVKLFAILLTISVIPSLFASYLWHYPSTIMHVFAVAGSVLLLLSLLWFFIMLRTFGELLSRLQPITRRIAAIAMASFTFKMVFQALTVVPSLGPLVFANRPVIIGFLHLVLLGFVTLYLLAHFIETALLKYEGRSAFAIWLFAAGVILNEIILFSQGLGFMLMMSSAIISWLLLAAAICLFTGALLLALSKWKMRSLYHTNSNQFFNDRQAISK